MKNSVMRLFVEKKPGFDVESQSLYFDIRDNLSVKSLKSLRIINRYDMYGITTEEYEIIKNNILSERPADNVYEQSMEINTDERVFAYEFLPGQYDQRADSAKQCIQLITKKEDVVINSSKMIILGGQISDEDFIKIKNYCINPVDSREAALEKPTDISKEISEPKEVEILEGFIESSDTELEYFSNKYKLAMSPNDLMFCRDYFRNKEKRNPTETEMKVIDTYWSDHCRHTTFTTVLQEVQIEDGIYSAPIKKAYEEYLASREFIYGADKKEITLMDIAVIGMKELRKKGLLNDLDISDEINACSIEIDVDNDGKDEKWLLMFKNETHNHPTEIEPFGGAATCLGGAIRDPLSGRSYVYQAMRVTGSGDPRQKIEDTLLGKLPQRKITLGAAQGYSSYGNQIGLATGQVSELYDEGFIAKRMEVGAVIGAVPKENVVRQNPQTGDVIVLIGGRTGRDGCGGATGSSKEHNEESIINCGAEVQKGNAPTERKIQRLFRNPKVSRLIKKCNDFGAGGAAVAIGELAESLEINLDLIPKKYEGLDGTELAISESQERMAVVISKENIEQLIRLSEEENLEATVVARVTEDNRLKMCWKGKYIVNIDRDFLSTNGVSQSTVVKIATPSASSNYFISWKEKSDDSLTNLKAFWLHNLEQLNICSQRGLAERFDSTIGANTILMPFGGKYQATPAEGMAAKIPVNHGNTNTASLMAYGYNPSIGKWSPYHGALYAVVEASAKITAMGGDYKKVRLSLQEYFEKPGQDPFKWGKPFSALLGALQAQKQLGTAAIGGKDSMSGTYKDLNVPPTLIAFAVCTAKTDNIISPEFKKLNSQVILLPALRNEDEIPDFEILKQNFDKVNELIQKKKVLSAQSVRHGGISEAISKMCFGNRMGFKFNEQIDSNKLFEPSYGSIIIELEEKENLNNILGEIKYEILGTTQVRPIINVGDKEIEIKEAYEHYEGVLESIFPTKAEEAKQVIENIQFDNAVCRVSKINIAKPRVFIPVFPGTNCEYDSNKAFERAGGIVKNLVFNNLSSSHIETSIDEMVKEINKSQIIMLPGGFSAGDEPDGSGKFIAAVFRNEKIKDAVSELLYARDGLILGICNGFQALIKLGLLPYGEIRDLDENSPTLTYNKIGRHVSCMVRTKITSSLSPWFNNLKVGDIHWVPISHGEGRFVGRTEVIKELIKNGQVAAQYVDFNGNASLNMPHNPNGSMYAVEAITSPDGRVLGKMAHSERIGSDILKNIPGDKDQKLFEAGINYFK